MKLYHNLIFFFFFSSRRRHTRCLSDWSSDVCSSDLFPAHADVLKDQIVLHRALATENTAFGLRESETAATGTFNSGHSDGTHAGTRSEERRVGKECRSRWSQAH